MLIDRSDRSIRETRLELVERTDHRVMRLQQHLEILQPGTQHLSLAQERQQQLQPFRTRPPLAHYVVPRGFLPREELDASRDETHAGVFVLGDDRLDEVGGVVDGSDGLAGLVADVEVGGGEGGGETEMVAARRGKENGPKKEIRHLREGRERERAGDEMRSRGRGGSTYIAIPTSSALPSMKMYGFSLKLPSGLP